MDRRLSELENRILETERGVAANAANHSAHEQVCAERYANLGRQHDEIKDKLEDGKARFKRMEWIVIAALIAATGGTAAVETAARVVSQMSGGG